MRQIDQGSIFQFQQVLAGILVSNLADRRSAADSQALYTQDACSIQDLAIDIRKIDIMTERPAGSVLAATQWVEVVQETRYDRLMYCFQVVLAVNQHLSPEFREFQVARADHVKFCCDQAAAVQVIAYKPQLVL